jgi:hypothetical protein
MNWYIIHTSCHLLIHVILILKMVYQAFLSCITPPTIFVHPTKNSAFMSHNSNWPILHDKQLHHPHSHHPIHIYELAMLIYVITTAPILLILNLGVYISWKLKSCKFTNSSLNSRDLFNLWLSHTCSMTSKLCVPTGISKMKVDPFNCTFKQDYRKSIQMGPT